MSRYAKGYTNQLIVLSDGANRDSSSAATLDGLLRYLRQARDPKRPVRIVCIGYGADADIKALTKIAETTGGRAALAKTPEEVPDAVRLALFTL